MEIVQTGVQKKWTRLSQMSWDELRTRVGQEISKRLDLAFCRSGFGPTPLRLKDRPHQVRFFFATGEARSRAELLRKHLPEAAAAIIREAEEICRHDFRLLGCEKISLGRDIDWHFAQASGKPLQPWFKINFLDFAAVGDHKIVWELNRHQHLVTLAKAWLLSGKAAYVDEAVAQWNSWQKANPYPLGINWASTLEVAFRSLSWLWLRNLLAECPEFSTTFQEELLSALQVHGRHIERYLSTYFSPNTHLLGEAVGLFFIGTLCPEIEAADRWRKLGWDILLRESERQVRPDGVYFEQALYYHVYALDFFLHARTLAAVNGAAIPREFDNVLKKMLDVVESLSTAEAIEGFGDDDGGRVFNARRNCVEHMTDPLAVGAVLYECDKYSAASLTEESIWLFGDPAVQALEKPNRAPDIASRTFPSGGIYLLNDDKPSPQQLMIDAGPQGIGRSGHGHADALSIRMSIDRRRILVDPGTYCYVSDGKERDYFRGTSAHNTMRVDELDQAVAAGPFAWSQIPNVTAERWVNGRTFDFFVGRHDGYRRLSDPVLHRRFVFHVKSGFWLVRDQVLGQGQHLLETFWHFAPDIEITEERGNILAKPGPEDVNSEATGLVFLIDRRSVWKTELIDGFVSPAYRSKQSAPVLRVSANVKLPQDCGVLLLPATRASDIGTMDALTTSVGEVCGYRYRTVDITESLFLAQENAVWTCGDWRSDAGLLYCKIERGRFAHVIMTSASFAEWRGKRLVSLLSGSDIFEWQRQSEANGGSSSGDLALDNALVADLEALDSVT